MTPKALDWQEFKRALPLSSEISNHPHSPSESAERFLSVSFEPTELEYLDLIHCVTLASKPKLVLETGTHYGLSTTAIAFALRQNSIGIHEHASLISVEKDAARADCARALICQRGLNDIVTVINAESVSFLASEYSGGPFDLVYFDSSRTIRPLEFEVLRSRSLISANAFLLFHDTSVDRASSMPDQIQTQRQYLSALDEAARFCSGRVVFGLSRGLTMMQFAKDYSNIGGK
jgi:predicted O-methyltransferase YrrM